MSLLERIEQVEYTITHLECYDKYFWQYILAFFMPQFEKFEFFVSCIKNLGIPY